MITLRRIRTLALKGDSNWMAFGDWARLFFVLSITGILAALAIHAAARLFR